MMHLSKYDLDMLDTAAFHVTRCGGVPSAQLFVLVLKNLPAVDRYAGEDDIIICKCDFIF